MLVVAELDRARLLKSCVTGSITVGKNSRFCYRQGGKDTKPQGHQAARTRRSEPRAKTHRQCVGNDSRSWLRHTLLGQQQSWGECAYRVR